MELTTTPQANSRFSQFIESTAQYFAVASVVALPLSTTLTDVLLMLAIITSIMAGNYQKKIHAIINNPVAWMFAAFFGLYLIGSIYSVAPSHDISKSLLKNAKLLYGALLIPLFVDQRTRQLAINALLGVITVIMLLSYAKAFGWISLTERYRDAAVFKSHIQTNFLMAFYAYLLADRAMREAKWRNLFIGLLVLATIKTFFFSEGRTGYLIYAALITLFGWQHWRWRGAAIGLISASLLLGGALYFSKTFQDRFSQVVNDSQKFHAGDASPTSTGLRISFYQNAIKIIKISPFVGSGTGSVITRYQQFEPNPHYQTHNPHNEYFNIGIQLGLIGVAFLLFFFIRIGWCSYALDVPWSNIAQATVVAIALGCTLNSWLLDTMQGHFFAMMMAICFASFKTSN